MVLTLDIYQRYLKPDATQAHYILVGRLSVIVLLAIAYTLAVTKLDFLVLLVALSGAGALQLMPAVLGVCFPTRSLLTRSGILAGIATGLATLYVTTVIVPHPFGLHAGVWSPLANALIALSVSRFTQPPSAQTVQRIHGAIEDYVYGKGDEGIITNRTT